jgi:hypothetical protein
LHPHYYYHHQPPLEERKSEDFREVKGINLEDEPKEEIEENWMKN